MPGRSALRIRATPSSHAVIARWIAVALSISQSALSHRLADAEQRMGVKLFDSGPGRRLQPTEAGTVVQQAATLALAELQRCEDDVLRSAGRYSATVPVAVETYENYHWFAPFRSRLRTARPTNLLTRPT
jgi:LysR family transcriptional regulator for metE and metH